MWKYSGSALGRETALGYARCHTFFPRAVRSDACARIVYTSSPYPAGNSIGGSHAEILSIVRREPLRRRAQKGTKERRPAHARASIEFAARGRETARALFRMPSARARVCLFFIGKVRGEPFRVWIPLQLQRVYVCTSIRLEVRLGVRCN